jgi:hypothetical protein
MTKNGADFGRACDIKGPEGFGPFPHNRYRVRCVTTASHVRALSGDRIARLCEAVGGVPGGAGDGRSPDRRPGAAEMHARGETADLVRLAPGRHRWRAARHRTVGGTRQSVEMGWDRPDPVTRARRRRANRCRVQCPRPERWAGAGGPLRARAPQQTPPTVRQRPPASTSLLAHPRSPNRCTGHRPAGAYAGGRKTMSSPDRASRTRKDRTIAAGRA